MISAMRNPGFFIACMALHLLSLLSLAADDDFSIQQALSDASPGDVIMIPPGVYEMDEHLSIPKGVLLWAENEPDKTTLRFPRGDDGFILMGDYAGIVGFRIECDNIAIRCYANFHLIANNIIIGIGLEENGPLPPEVKEFMEKQLEVSSGVIIHPEAGTGIYILNNTIVNPSLAGISIANNDPSELVKLTRNIIYMEDHETKDNMWAIKVDGQPDLDETYNLIVGFPELIGVNEFPCSGFELSPTSQFLKVDELRFSDENYHVATSKYTEYGAYSIPDISDEISDFFGERMPSFAVDARGKLLITWGRIKTRF